MAFSEKQNIQSSAINRLIERFSRLPGIGRRSAERMAFYLLKAPPEEAALLAKAISDFKSQLKICSTCGNASEMDPCPICHDPERNHKMVLVVEQPCDIANLEITGQYNGLYHVLMGRLAPLDGIGPGELNIQGLLRRLENESIDEVILGTNPTAEGDGTALYLAQQIAKYDLKVTRLARGMPTGSTLDTVSKAVLGDAIQSRQNL